MPQVLTVSCKLDVAPHPVEKLDALLSAFANCCEVANTHTPERLTHQIALQSLIYKEARAHSVLSAQMTIHTIRRVCASRKAAKQKGRPVQGFAPTPVTDDTRTFTLRQSDRMLSRTMLKGTAPLLVTLHRVCSLLIPKAVRDTSVVVGNPQKGCRERLKLHIGNYQKKHLLAGQNPKSATLVKRKDGSFYSQIQLESEPPSIPDTDKVLGIDLGRTDIAWTSEGEQVRGEKINQTRDRYNRVRAALPRKASKGTRSSRRRCRQILKQLGGCERRFQTWLNHTIVLRTARSAIVLRTARSAISHRLVQKARPCNRAIAIEDLTGIRERTHELPCSRAERRRSRAFYQLRQFLIYKGMKLGVSVRLVDWGHTSRTCHGCKVIGNWQGKGFEWVNPAGFWMGEADVNGAKNIAILGVLVNNPGGSGIMSCSFSLRDVILRAAVGLGGAEQQSPLPTTLAVGFSARTRVVYMETLIHHQQARHVG